MGRGHGEEVILDVLFESPSLRTNSHQPGPSPTPPPAPTPPGWHIFEKQDAFGGDNLFDTAGPVSSCEKQCEARSDCHGFSVWKHNERCYYRKQTSDQLIANLGPAADVD